MVKAVRRDGLGGLYFSFLPHCFEALPHDISEMLVRFKTKSHFFTPHLHKMAADALAKVKGHDMMAALLTAPPCIWRSLGMTPYASHHPHLHGMASVSNALAKGLKGALRGSETCLLTSPVFGRAHCALPLAFTCALWPCPAPHDTCCSMIRRWLSQFKPQALDYLELASRIFQAN